MKKRGKKKKDPKQVEKKADQGALTHRPFQHPFKGLTVNTSNQEAEPVPTPKPDPEPEPDEVDESTLFTREMEDVAPLSNVQVLAEKQAKPKPLLAQEDEESLVMRQLDELVHGDMSFDFADTNEYIEASIEGFDRSLVRKLKRGEYSIQAHLDLHGLNREKARLSVAEFIRTCHREGKRSILIVHGRGIGSKDNIPVLKNKLSAWLTRGAIGRKVLAFTSAKPYDGGTGAVYVLLRS
ncbi:MAG: DNA mismatch repair protein MutS [Proteobacteria bacterium]|nr:DNA mismatch repair protein MutS [Pseudomonadota bacterium]